MTTEWVSPGGGGFPTQTYTGDVPATAFFPRKVLKARGAQVFRPIIRPLKGTPLVFTVDITGANVVSAHLQAVEAMIPEMVGAIQSITGKFAVAMSQAIVPVDTGDTQRSINHQMVTAPSLIDIDVGPKTFYAPFIEYGMGGHTHIGPRPFMTDTFFRVIPFWLQAFKDLARVIARGVRGGGIVAPPYSADLNARMRRWRKHLYSIEKQLGDYIPLGIPTPGFFRAFRGGLIGSARILGDVQSVMGRIIGLRVKRRLVGRVTGRLIGIGSHTVFGDRTYGVSVSPIGQRAYNRVAGKAMTKFVDQNRVFRGFLNA